MKNYCLMTLFFLGIMFLLPVNLVAQYNIMADYNTTHLAIQAAVTAQRASTIREGLRSSTRGVVQSGAELRGENRAKSSPAKNAVRGKTTFSSTGTLIIPKIVAQKVGKTAEDKRVAEAAMVKALDTFEGLFKDKGYARNDVARSSAVLFATCLNIYSGSKMTPKQLDGVYSAFKVFYETDSYFQSLNNLDRQKNYEMHGLLWGTVFIKAFVALENPNDRASKQTARDTAAKVFEEFVGTSIKNVRLNPNGFQID